MTRNTIGQFIAALRKTNGMTQQEVADRLNVSNKAVSRWERDECAPDISLIPSIAEMFGVTCDELLKGERITLSDTTEERKEPKVQKQLKGLINRTLSGFKTLTYISLAVSVVALICMFGISYGFLRPIIGFAAMLLLEAGAVILAVLALSRAKAAKTDNELFEDADESLTAKFDNTLGSFSFTAFFAALSAVLLSLPLIIFVSDYIESVLSFESYFTEFFGGIVLILTFIFVKCRKPYIRKISDRPKDGLRSPVKGKIMTMNIIQLCSIVILGFNVTFLPVSVACDIVSSCCLAAVIACFVIFLTKNGGYRGDFVFHGLRNIALAPAAVLFSNFITVFWGDSELGRYVSFNCQWLWYTAVYVIFICLVFSVIDIFVKSKKSNR